MLLADTMLGTDAVDRLLGDHPSRVSAFHAAARLKYRTMHRTQPMLRVARPANRLIHVRQYKTE